MESQTSNTNKTNANICIGSTTNTIVGTNENQKINTSNDCFTNISSGSITSIPIYPQLNASFANANYLTEEYAPRKKPISYTKLDGLEEVVFIDPNDIIKFTRMKKKNRKSFFFKKQFPFIDFNVITYTDVAFKNNDGSIVNHIQALESPTMMANKFGLSYEKTSALDFINDDLEGN